MRIDIDPYDATARLISYHVDHVMSLDELRMYILEDLVSTIKNCPDTMEHLLDRTGISPEDQACIRKHYKLEEVSDES
jgi:hypothetical protein